MQRVRPLIVATLIVKIIAFGCGPFAHGGGVLVTPAYFKPMAQLAAAACALVAGTAACPVTTATIGGI